MNPPNFRVLTDSDVKLTEPFSDDDDCSTCYAYEIEIYGGRCSQYRCPVMIKGNNMKTMCHARTICDYYHPVIPGLYEYQQIKYDVAIRIIAPIIAILTIPILVLVFKFSEFTPVLIIEASLISIFMALIYLKNKRVRDNLYPNKVIAEHRKRIKILLNQKYWISLKDIFSTLPLDREDLKKILASFPHSQYQLTGNGIIIDNHYRIWFLENFEKECLAYLSKKKVGKFP